MENTANYPTNLYLYVGKIKSVDTENPEYIKDMPVDFGEAFEFVYTRALRKHWQDVIKDYFINGLSYNTIAVKYNVTRQAVQQGVHRSIKKILRSGYEPYLRLGLAAGRNHFDELKKDEAKRKENPLLLSITEVAATSKCRNAMMKNKLFTLGEIRDKYNSDELISMRSVGVGIVQEIKNILTFYGLI